jgi:hypothetical protein
VKKRPTKIHYIPIINCPCGYEGPLSFRGLFSKNIEDRHCQIAIWSCPECDRAPMQPKEINIYASEAELLATGWVREEGAG